MPIFLCVCTEVIGTVDPSLPDTRREIENIKQVPDDLAEQPRPKARRSCGSISRMEVSYQALSAGNGNGNGNGDLFILC